MDGTRQYGGVTTYARVLALARPTFDIDHGAAQVDAAASMLRDVGVHVDESDIEIISTPRAAAARVEDAVRTKSEVVVVLQATFTDATAVIRLAESSDIPIVVWSFPEARTGGVLRLNSMCGANLAAFSLRARDHRCAFVHGDPRCVDTRTDLLAAIRDATGHSANAAPVRDTRTLATRAAAPVVERLATRTIERLARSRIGVIGRPPDGFEPCAGSAVDIRATFGVDVRQLELSTLFDEARNASGDEVRTIGRRIRSTLVLDHDATLADTTPSQRLYCGLRCIADDERLDALATRCWPECMEDFGGAACSAQAMLTDDGVPAVCEADLLGALTALVLRCVSDDAPFVADLVDVDCGDNTSVVWHCGVAAASLADPGGSVVGTVHPNRRIPLVNEFALRHGRVTVARISRCATGYRLVLARATMLRRTRPFLGTCGVLRWDQPGADVVDTIFDHGIEHHLGIAYGDHCDVLVELARRWDIPVLWLGQAH